MVLTKRVHFFDEQFYELFDMARPFMSEYNLNAVDKLIGKAKNTFLVDQLKEIQEECLWHFAQALVNFLTKTSAEIGPTPAANVRRLRGFVDQLIAEAASK